MPILGKKLAHQVSLDKKGAKTIMQRLGLVKTSTTGGDGDSMVQSPGHTMSQVDNPTYQFSSRNKGDEPSQTQSETAIMEDLLNRDSLHHKEFIEFVKKQYAENELALLEQAILYKRAKTSKERQKIGNLIMKKFINSGAQQQVDIPDGVKRILNQQLIKICLLKGPLIDNIKTLMFEIRGNFVDSFEKRSLKMQQPIDNHPKVLSKVLFLY